MGLASLKQKMKSQITVALIRRSPFFDEQYYRTRTGIEDTADAALHYYQGGWRSCDPSPAFRQDLYLKANRDVEKEDLCPLGHYVLYGKLNRRELYPGMVDCSYHAYGGWRAVRRGFYEILFHGRIRRNRNARILVVLHIYYENAIPEILEYLKNLRKYSFDLLVTTTKENNLRTIQKLILPFAGRARILTYENRGFDIAPFLFSIRETDLNLYDIVIKVQTKQLFSTRDWQDTGEFSFKGRDWFLYLMESTLGARRCHTNIDRLMRDPDTQLIAARDLLLKDTPPRRRLARYRLKKKGLKLPDPYVFVAGSCFSVRAEALKPLQEMKLSWDDFEATRRGVFSMAHAMERYLTGNIPLKKGVNVCAFRHLRSQWARARRAGKPDGEPGKNRERTERTKPDDAEANLTIAFAFREEAERSGTEGFSMPELAEHLKGKGCSIVLAEQSNGDSTWEKIGEDADVLISLSRFYPLSRIQKTSGLPITAAWVRDYPDLWMESEETDGYDLIMTDRASVRKEMQEILQREVVLFPAEGSSGRTTAEQEPVLEDGREAPAPDEYETNAALLLKLIQSFMEKKTGKVL